jgi:quercetin dioxygenase-like cupin family protein
MNKSRLHKFNPDYTWSEVAKEPYKPSPGATRHPLPGAGEGIMEQASVGPGTSGAPETAGCFCGIDRQTIIGMRGESARFHVRYFEVEPGGHSSLEKHEHEHAVICVRGKGRALAGDKVFEVGFMDALYVAPNEPHQLFNPFEEPFGFICIVDAERDRPMTLDEEDIKKLDESDETKGKYIGYVEGD